MYDLNRDSILCAIVLNQIFVKCPDWYASSIVCIRLNDDGPWRDEHTSITEINTRLVRPTVVMMFTIDCDLKKKKKNRQTTWPKVTTGLLKNRWVRPILALLRGIIGRYNDLYLHGMRFQAVRQWLLFITIIMLLVLARRFSKVGR